MEATALPIFREQLLDRRRKLERAAVHRGADEVSRLLQEVDAALGRLETGTFGLCETCHDPIEADRLLADPLTRFCLDHLTASEQRALEQDLDLASRIQRELLPKAETRLDGWEIAYHYQPAGPVSGDYCDLIRGRGGELYFAVGDVAGKGVAAAMLMSHLSAMLRTLIPVGLPLATLMERASRVFCESTLPSHYATLVCGCASPSGEIELCNAGHPPPLVIREKGITAIDATGLPIGMFSSEQFASHVFRLEPGDLVLLYSDGLIEAQGATGVEYGVERLSALAASATGAVPAEVVSACVRDVTRFRDARPVSDDLTVMAIRRAAGAQSV
jgi:sigma-B regulation protein RsbU (phosphoserine phosphatase)